jgi:RHS repeat-associated protein
MTVHGGSNAGTYFYSYDGNGNVAALVCATNGAVTANYEYGPFGEVIRATGPMAKANPFRFATEYYDDESDMIYYAHRYYNPSTGRWLSRDPMGEPGFEVVAQRPRKTETIDVLGFQLTVESPNSDDPGPNLYEFVGDNPENNTDSLGLGFGGVWHPWQNPPRPTPPTCTEACALKYLLGISAAAGVGTVGTGLPVIPKPVQLPGATQGTSVARAVADAIIGDARFSGRLPTICCTGFRYTNRVATFGARWIPLIGWVFITYDVSGFAGCACGCNGI